MLLVIDKKRCPAQQGLCKAIPACPVQAILYVVDENEPLGGRIEIDDTLCTECGACIEACCGKAISMN